MYRHNPSTNAAARHSEALRRWYANGAQTQPPTPEGELAEALHRLNGPNWALLSRAAAILWARHGGKNPPRHCLCEFCRKR